MSLKIFLQWPDNDIPIVDKKKIDTGQTEAQMGG